MKPRHDDDDARMMAMMKARTPQHSTALHEGREGGPFVSKRRGPTLCVLPCYAARDRDDDDDARAVCVCVYYTGANREADREEIGNIATSRKLIQDYPETSPELPRKQICYS